MNLSRRGFLGGIIAAPAIVRASSLMPIKSWLITPAEAPPAYLDILTMTRAAFIPSSVVEKYWESDFFRQKLVEQNGQAGIGQKAIMEAVRNHFRNST